MKPFLTAEWRKLLVINYEIDPSILRPYLPAGTELDLFEGKCYVSLIGFMFLNTKVKGVRFPGLSNFEEVNLRFYVRRKVGNEIRRGVVFIKELVPNKILSTVANLFYKEHYKAVPMGHKIALEEDKLEVLYSWKYAGIEHEIKAEAGPISSDLVCGTDAHFILEHYFGYTKISNQISYEYEVLHPAWQVYPVHNFSLRVDFGKVYGSSFAFLTQMVPCSVFLAEGSDVSVMDKVKILI